MKRQERSQIDNPALQLKEIQEEKKLKPKLTEGGGEGELHLADGTGSTMFDE